MKGESKYFISIVTYLSVCFIVLYFCVSEWIKIMRHSLSINAYASGCSTLSFNGDSNTWRRVDNRRDKDDNNIEWRLLLLDMEVLHLPIRFFCNDDLDDGDVFEEPLFERNMDGNRL